MKLLQLLVVVCALAVVIWFFSRFGPGVDARIDSLIDELEPACAALVKSTREHGEPPASLAAAGVSIASGEVEYRRMWPDGVRERVWYDLGSRDGAPTCGASKGEFGDPAHAVLVLSFGGDERLKIAELDRMPCAVADRAFSSADWRAASNRRFELVRGWQTANGSKKTTREQILAALGEPSGTAESRAITWELRVRASPEVRLVRRGDDDYPDWEFGGPPIVHRRWAEVSTVDE